MRECIYCMPCCVIGIWFIGIAAIIYLEWSFMLFLTEAVRKTRKQTLQSFEVYYQQQVYVLFSQTSVFCFSRLLNLISRFLSETHLLLLFDVLIKTSLIL